MNEREMSAKMMAVINRIAQNANDPVYVKNTAEDFLGDLFCDYLKNGARAMFCMTDKGPAYILDTEYGSYSVPFVVLNKKLAAALSASTNAMIESEDEKKKLTCDLDNSACGSDKLNDIIETKEHHTIIEENKGTDEALSDEYASSTTTVPFVASSNKESSEEESKNSMSEPQVIHAMDDTNDNMDEISAIHTEVDVEAEFDTVNKAAVNDGDNSEPEFEQTKEVEETYHEAPISIETKKETSSIVMDEKNESTASNVAAFRDSFVMENADNSSEEFDEEDKIYAQTEKQPNHQDSIDTQSTYEEDSEGTKNEEIAELQHKDYNDHKENNHVTENSQSAESEEKQKKKSPLWRFKKNVTQEIQKTPIASDNNTNKKFAGIREVIESAEEVKPFEFPNDGGELFKHTHNITITMKYNVASIVGKYTVEFWPTWIQTKMGANGQTYAECLVRISDDNGTEMIAITDRMNKEFSYKFQGTAYTFKMVGVWNSGMLTTHVSIDDDSKYKLIDDFKREEPNSLPQNFLEQFESAERGQPQYFIVPLRSDNRGEAKIPIIGIAKDGNNKYILARLNDNTCQYRHNNKTREISGHWEKGKFHISIV